MLINGMNLSLIISCAFIICILIVLPLIVSHRAEKKKDLNEWDKIKDYGNKLNKKNKL
jgi:hypothetical protein